MQIKVNLTETKFKNFNILLIHSQYMNPNLCFVAFTLNWSCIVKCDQLLAFCGAPVKKTPCTMWSTSCFTIQKLVNWSTDLMVFPHWLKIFPLKNMWRWFSWPHCCPMVRQPPLPYLHFSARRHPSIFTSLGSIQSANFSIHDVLVVDVVVADVTVDVYSMWDKDE